MASIDLNSDLGESYGAWSLGDDDAMLGIITSANVACGFHAGDPSTLRAVCATAADNGVTIGAQVSYPDLAGFGRRRMDIDPGELRDLVLYQLGALDAFAKAAGSRVRYVKPHGALYHAAASDAATADAIVAAAIDYDHDLAIVGLAGSSFVEAAAAAGLDAVDEAFADRAYQPSGELVPRGRPGALITDPAHVAARVVQMAVEHEVVAIDGTVISVDAQSICVHGDTPGAVDIARAVRSALDRSGVTVEPFRTGR